MSRRALFILFIALWISALPLAIAAVLGAVHIAGSGILHYGITDIATSPPVIAKLFMLAALWTSFYLFVGWIPLLVIHASVPKRSAK